MKKILLTVAAGAALFAGCSADKTDFKKTAEKTIQDEAKKQLDITVTAVCDEPTATKVGTTFTCTATATDGTVYNFTAEITKSNEVTVNQA